MCGVDYNCQDAYFTNYAMNRYGGWEGAYSFWVNPRLVVGLLTWESGAVYIRLVI